ncbi:MAG TPA: dihydrofolate reductase family protein [Chloroflexia bacterium]|nr:dihydrofolate reductase family protein [Chloroflexia bacterium]
MKIILLAVVTIDGKLARNEHHFVDWSSPEDKKLFYSATRKAGVLIVGHNTFRTFPSPLPGRLHVVLTRDMRDKVDVPGAVEYTDRSPQEIVAGLEARGYSEAVMAGGGAANALFLKAGLVDEIWLTIEPLIFGVGIDLFTGEEVDVRARLLSVEKLNEDGTVHLKYNLR